MYATFPLGKRMKEKQYVTVQSCCLMHYWKEPSYCYEQTSLKPLRNRIGCFAPKKNEGKRHAKSGFVFGFFCYCLVAGFVFFVGVKSK